MSPDGSLAMAIDEGNVVVNLHVMGRASSEKSPMYTAGKYLCMNLIYPVDGKERLVISFYDVRANPDNMNIFLNDDEPSDDVKMRYKAALEMINLDYESIKDDYELILGRCPNLVD